MGFCKASILYVLQTGGHPPPIGTRRRRRAAATAALGGRVLLSGLVQARVFLAVLF